MKHRVIYELEAIQLCYCLDCKPVRKIDHSHCSYHCNKCDQVMSIGYPENDKEQQSPPEGKV